MQTDPDLPELLRRLGGEYRHFQQEHARERPRSTTRRRLHAEMADRARRFEQLVDHWVVDDGMREAWRRHLYAEKPAPEMPPFPRAPLFRGRTESGSVVEVLPADDGGYDIAFDGAVSVHEHVRWDSTPERIEPVQIHEHSCTETFAAPEAAVAALRDFLATPGAVPPWKWAQALRDDGIVDLELTLTPRGRRCLGAAPAPAPARAFNYCIVVAGAAQARILTLRSSTDGTVPTLDRMVEVGDLANPERRGRDSDLLSDTRPGLRREGPPTPRHGVDDRRGRRRQVVERRFAEQVVDEAARCWNRLGDCTVIVAASPEMLGALREAVSKLPRTNPRIRFDELGRDLSHFSSTAIHDALGGAGLVPPRGRLRPERRADIP